MHGIMPAIESHLSTFLITAVCRTIQVEEENTWFVRKRLFRENKGAVFCLWHNRLFYLTYYVASRFYHNYPHVSVLASQSRDGEKIANVIDVLGGTVIRGSSSQGGRQALRQAVRQARQGQALFLTPDGPRGPRYQVHDGIAFIARMAGQPVIPVTYGVSDYTQLDSWDRFVLPYPFTNGVVRFGDPIWPDENGQSTDGIKKRVLNGLENLDQSLRERGCSFA